MREITNELKLCLGKGLPCVVATIVQVEGSSYRKTGSRCIIRRNGDILGILSGGCIEDDLREHAADVLRTGKPRKISYDFRSSEDELWGSGLGCNGKVTIWLESFDPVRCPSQAEAMVQDLEARAVNAASRIVFTVLESEHDGGPYATGERWTEPGPGVAGASLGFTLPGGPAGISRAVIQGKRVEALVERIEPVPRLTIIGTGADAALLCEMAARYEWSVHIVYHETARAVREYFPGADAVRHVPRGDFTGIEPYPDHYAVVMTHNLELDRLAVQQLLRLEHIAYVGALGSDHRIGRIIDYVSGASGFSPQSLDKLYAPVGLDIGAATPEEITLSIMAELIAVRSRRSGGSLRSRSGLGRDKLSLAGAPLGAAHD